MQSDCLAIDAGVHAVGVEATGKGFVPFVDGLSQAAVEKA